jgi:hypothetical protein
LTRPFVPGAYSAKLLAGTKQRFSGLSHPRQCDVLRILETGRPPFRGGWRHSPSHQHHFAPGVRVSDGRRWIVREANSSKPTCGIDRNFAASVAQNFRSSARPSFLHSHPQPPPPATPVDGLSNRRVDLCRQRGPSSAIKFDQEGSHRAMVQPELPILVLFYDQGRTNLFARNQRLE